MVLIIELNSIFLIKNSFGFIKCNTMIPKICYVLFSVPFKTYVFHNYFIIIL